VSFSGAETSAILGVDVGGLGSGCDSLEPASDPDGLLDLLHPAFRFSDAHAPHDDR
jgi:hypothetical protein